MIIRHKKSLQKGEMYILFKYDIKIHEKISLSKLQQFINLDLICNSPLQWYLSNKLFRHYLVTILITIKIKHI